LLDCAPRSTCAAAAASCSEPLHDVRVAARGIDLDAGMVQRCQEKCLEVTVADALTYLAESDDGDFLRAIVLLQVIEHSP
jgi:hypothetical protein